MGYLGRAAPPATDRHPALEAVLRKLRDVPPTLTLMLAPPYAYADAYARRFLVVLAQFSFTGGTCCLLVLAASAGR